MQLRGCVGHVRLPRVHRAHRAHMLLGGGWEVRASLGHVGHIGHIGVPRGWVAQLGVT